MKKIASLLILIIAFGCNKNSNQFEDNFNLVDSLQLHNKILDSVNFHWFQYNEDINSFIFEKNNKLVGIDINSDKIGFEVNLHQLDSMEHKKFLYHNSDSIFISSIHQETIEMYITLINSKGEIIKNWNITNCSKKINGAYFYIKVDYLNPMVFLNNKLYFHASYNFKPGTIIKSTLPVEMALDLSNDSLIEIGDLPLKYKKGDFFGNYQKNYSRTFNNNKELIFSFPVCNQLFVYDTNGVLIKTVNCKSKYIDKIEPMEKDKYFNLSSIIDGYIYNAQYADIIYDTYNGSYYRIALHKLNKYTKDGKVNRRNNRKWSVIILNKDFKVINEVMMPGNKFWKYIIVTDKGLLMKATEKEVNLNKYYIFK